MASFKVSPKRHFKEEITGDKVKTFIFSMLPAKQASAFVGSSLRAFWKNKVSIALLNPHISHNDVEYGYYDNIPFSVFSSKE